MRATTWIGVGLVTVLVASQGIASGGNPTSEIPPITKRWTDAIGQTEFKACGLHKLDTTELTALENVIARALEAGSADNDLSRVARERMRRDGWEEVRVLGWVTKDYDDWLVVSGLVSKYATKDIPFGLSTFNLPAGVYWGKSALMGGLSEVVDSSGSEHSFFMAEWVALD